ncbi:amino acid ABC transporter permease [Anaeromyxobacter paludicola]|uniref:Amino acid ABC transporter permease n=1 Tax=Anaeromyxobacter paludicola TaxID=2918171 RepID=A0ABM7XF17_9BACT|nr:amino acid ABC transporter permease [Anaeromyxobacter paludicola]BDG10465.1 amino acid ABC transporter permease [Anaeromyxobacter paludicola]
MPTAPQDGSRTLWPASWTRQQRSTATILVSSFALVLFMWLVARPLARMPEPIGPAAEQFAEGTRVTVELTLVAGLMGMVAGVLAAVGKLSRFAPLRWAAEFYVWVIRGTPLLVQVLFVYLALPMMVPQLKLSDFNSAALALGVNVGAYNAEAIRAGIGAIPKGQTEAARSLGLSPLQTFGSIVFPQALKIALPPLVNNVVALLKDSSLAYVIGVVELSNIGNRVQAATFQPVPVFIATASIYLVLTTVLTQIAGAIELRMDVEQRH